MLEIVIIPVLNDNYVWLARDPESGEVVVVDPAVAPPVLEKAEELGWRITQIWNTHWHPDHTGGNEEIRAATDAIIIGPRGERDKIPSIDVAVSGGGSIRLGNLDVHVLDAPGHTAGHILFYLPGDKALFSGDTLFPMGCGRLFEGRPEEMFGVLKALEALPGDVRVYCAHEYTEANGRFALVTEPENVAIIERMRHVGASRLRGEPTVPTTIALERATNPFMRARSVEEFSQRRAAKDNF